MGTWCLPKSIISKKAIAAAMAAGIAPTNMYRYRNPAGLNYLHKKKNLLPLSCTLL